MAITLDMYPFAILDDETHERIEEQDIDDYKADCTNVMWCVEMDIRGRGDTRATAIITDWNFETKQKADKFYRRLAAKVGQ